MEKAKELRKQLKEFVKQEYTEPCEDYEVSCFNCTVWRTWEDMDLILAHSDGTWESA